MVKEGLKLDLYFKPFYKKDSYIIDTDISFDDDSDFEASVHKYYINSGFNLYAVDDEYSITEEIVATVNAIFFNIKDIYNEGVNIVDVADIIDTPYTDDIVCAIESCLDNNLLSGTELNSIESICYLNRVYIYPEYRNNGIATYIFENLKDIFEYITGRESQIVLIYPKPQEPEGYGWHNIEDKNNIMLNKMISKIEQFQFKPFQDTGFYIKTF